MSCAKTPPPLLKQNPVGDSQLKRLPGESLPLFNLPGRSRNRAVAVGGPCDVDRCRQRGGAHHAQQLLLQISLLAEGETASVTASEADTITAAEEASARTSDSLQPGRVITGMLLLQVVSQGGGDSGAGRL